MAETDEVQEVQKVEEASPIEGETEAPPSEGPKPETVDKDAYEKLQARYQYNEREKRRLERELQEREIKQEPKREQKGKPNEDDFDSYNEYVEAVADWKAEEKLSVLEQRAQQITEQKKLNDRKARLDDLVATETAKDPDFIQKALIPTKLEDVIIDSEYLAEIALYLGSNLDVAQKLVNMEKSAAAKEIGRIEARIEYEKKGPAPRANSKAPSTTKTVGGSEGPGKDPLKMSTEEYIVWKDRQEFGAAR